MRTLAVMPSDVIKGLYGLATDLPGTVANVSGQSADQWQKAKASAAEVVAPQGSISNRVGAGMETVGHTLGTIPFVGTPAAHAGEQAASGDLAGGLTNLGILIASLALPEALARAVPAVAKATGVGLGKTVLKTSAADTRAALSEGALPLTEGSTAKLQDLVTRTKPVTGYEYRPDLAEVPQPGPTTVPIRGESPFQGVLDKHTTAMNRPSDFLMRELAGGATGAAFGHASPTSIATGLAVGAATSPMARSIGGQLAWEIGHLPPSLWSESVRTAVMSGLAQQGAK
jgi:hypothetical protein